MSQDSPRDDYEDEAPGRSGAGASLFDLEAALSGSDDDGEHVASEESGEFDDLIVNDATPSAPQPSSKRSRDEGSALELSFDGLNGAMSGDDASSDSDAIRPTTKRKPRLDPEDLALIGVEESDRPRKRLKRLKDQNRGPEDALDDASKSRRQLADLEAELFAGDEMDIDDEPSEQQPVDEQDELDFSDEEELGEFIVDASNRPLRRPRVKRKGKSGFTAEQMEAARQIFGTTDFSAFEFEDILREDAMAGFEQMNEEELRQEHQRLIRETFDPTEIEEKFVTEFDAEVVETDIPERLQLRYYDRPTPTTQELKEEADYIIRHALNRLAAMNHLEGSSHYSLDELERRVLAILDLLLVKHCEVPYIITYQKDVWYTGRQPHDNIDRPTLRVPDIWQIFEYDQRYYQLVQKKSKLVQLFNQAIEQSADESIKSELEDRKALVGEADDLQTLEDFTDFLHFSFPDVRLENNDRNYKRPKQARDLASMALNGGLDKMARILAVSPKELGDAFFTGSKLRPIDDPESVPFDMAENYSSPDFPTSSLVLRGVRSLLAKQYSVEPFVRAELRQIWESEAYVSTHPSPDGRRLIDVYHKFAPIKELIRKPLIKFSESPYVTQFALIREAAKDDMVKYTIDVGRQARTTMLDKLRIIQTAGHGTYSREWNEERQQIAQQLLDDYLIPVFRKQTEEKLKRESEEAILNECSTRLEQILVQGPFTRESAEMPELDVGQELTYMTCTYGGGKQRNLVHCVVVDQEGELKDYVAVTFSRNTHSKDVKDVTDFILEHAPSVIGIGTDSMDSRRLFSEIFEITQNIQDKYKKQMSDRVPPLVTFVESDAAILFTNSPDAGKEFPDHQAGVKRGVSLARRLIEPLAEFSRLVNRRRELSFINLHPLQNCVPEMVFDERMERVFVGVVNAVGVNLNQLARHPWRRSMLQFVSGLGPRKAQSLMHDLTKDAILPSREAFKLLHGVGDVIYTNCVGFIRFDHDDINEEGHLLDTMRIHPFDYSFAMKMARDAIGDDDGSMHDQDVLEQLLADPERLEQIDIMSYNEHLLRQQRISRLHLLYDIKNELNNPFKDFRSFTEVPVDRLFDLLTGSTDQTLHKGTLVSATILPRHREGPKSIMALVQPYDIMGIVSLSMLPDSVDPLNISAMLADRAVVPAVVQSVDKSRFNCFLSLRSFDIENAPHMFIERPFDDLPADHHLRIESLLSADMEEEVPPEKEVRPRFTRAVVHPLFKNFNSEEARAYLSDKEPGEVIIRPSSSDYSHLIITMKFYDDLIFDIQVEEQNKINDWSLGKPLVIGQETFEDLNELSVSFIDPMAQFANDVVTSKKFVSGPRDVVETELKEQKRSNPNGIPYAFGLAYDAPGRFILYYLPKKQIFREYVAVTSSGFYFRKQSFKDLDKLTNWFKRHYKEIPREAPPSTGGVAVPPRGVPDLTQGGYGVPMAQTYPFDNNYNAAQSNAFINTQNRSYSYPQQQQQQHASDAYSPYSPTRDTYSDYPRDSYNDYSSRDRDNYYRDDRDHYRDDSNSRGYDSGGRGGDSRWRDRDDRFDDRRGEYGGWNSRRR